MTALTGITREGSVNGGACPWAKSAFFFEAVVWPHATAAYSADFGITVGQRYGLKMDVTLRIQVEAIRAD